LNDGHLSRLYPLWIGLLASALFGLLLYEPGGRDAVDAGSADAASPDVAAPVRRPDAPASLVWRVEDRAAPEADALRQCLGELDYAAAVTGLGDLSVTWKGVVTSVTPEGTGVRLATPAAGHCHDAAGLHIAAAFCLRADGATLVDPLLKRRRERDEWVRPRADGGLPMDALLKIVDRRTQGLARFGLPELEAPSASTSALYRAAGAFLVGCDPEVGALTLVGGGRGALTHRSGASSLVEIEDARPKPVTPTRATRRRRRPKAPALPRPAKPKPVFQPDYR